MKVWARHPNYVLFISVFALCLAPICINFGASRGVLLSFDVAALVFLASAILSMRGAPPEIIRTRAARNDGGHGWLSAVTVVVLGIVLTAVTLESNGIGSAIASKILPLTTLALAWAFTNIVFTLHYAHLYYRSENGSDAGGLQMPTDVLPTYLEFCYFSFVVGMTFQVSDIAITRRDIRSVCLAHSLIAFIFNVGVVALSVNILGSS